MQRRRFLKTALALGAAPALIRNAAARKRPNILYAMSDDQSYPHASAYGARFVNTPAFDRAASEGCLFTNAFAAAPQCSPNRAAILTGRHIWQLREAGTHSSYFPKDITVFPDLLERTGYHIGYTAKGWGPGNWQDAGRDRNPAGPAYNARKMKEAPEGVNKNDYAGNFEDFLKQRPKDAPFYFWYGGTEPHRGYSKGIGLASGKKLEDVDVPPFLPDTEEVRSDLLDYAFEIEWFDMHLARMMETLEKRGELDDTLIVVTSDNGMPFPGAKATLYEYGVHMPLAIRWANGARAGAEIGDLVSFIDFAPVFLEAAGVDIPGSITGRSFLSTLQGGSQSPRECVFAGRERHSHSRFDNLGYPARCVRAATRLYIRNLKPDRWLAGDPPRYHDIDDGPTKAFMIDRRNDDAVRALFAHGYGEHPAEELYDVAADPGCLNNLAGDPAHEAERKRLFETLWAEMERTGDPRAVGDEVFDSYPRFGKMRPELGGFAEQGKYNPKYQR
ncbi:MAG: sulfatase-like hydrolase/transferase [bacterium]|nr:sulfatase-like hydrolase/transferase [bacterium]